MSKIRENETEQIVEWLKMRSYEKSHSLILALGLLELREDPETKTMGSDDFCLYVNQTWLREAFLLDSEALWGLFLHVLCHCMLRHPFRYRERERRENRDVWLRESGQRQNRESRKVRMQENGQRQNREQENRERENQEQESWEQEAWELLEHILEDTEGQGQRRQKKQKGQEELREQNRFFGMDDHSLWAKRDGGREEAAKAAGDGGDKAGQEGWEEARKVSETPAGQRGREEKQQKRWESARRAVAERACRQRQTGSRRMSVVQSLTLTRERRCDYRSFLQRFSSLREEGGLDPEQFDYGLYFQGLEEYGNIPLIEPLEYRERQKIEELVIVIDTSGSCSRELVQMFLEETRGILKEEELFFCRFRLHIIQCDNQVQRDDRITSQEELDEYLRELTVTGGGGTDFRPAFARIEELRKEELYHLKGVLYFTDGYGIYPGKMPDYQVAFVFFKHRYDDIDVPDWALKLVLDAERPRGAGA